ncbi:MAG: HD domain-containing protein [Daejeonella sp.]|uniref:HD domain-containing protein n=1 Tax=Daejeonella sp. JGW-45 TaxID=3034148 RepID=UPI0023ECACEC|nr:HD domain-containing protein [Daejeonella sp. JGW-45]
MAGLSSHTQQILDKVSYFADQAHGEQTRKYTPDRYIVHPIRVMKMLSEYTGDISMLAAALLHDVLEDTPVSSTDIRAFLQDLLPPPEVRKTIKLVEELTDVYVKSAFPHLNRRQRKDLEVERIAKTSGDSQSIKYADIIDNCTEIVRHDRGFAGRFLSECREILRKAPHGDQRLYERAVMTLDAAMRELR